MLITQDQERLKTWLEEKLETPSPPNTVFFGKEVGGVLLSVAGYSGYSPETSSIYLHLAGALDRNWLTRDFVWFMFAYPFIQLQLSTLLAPIRVSNERCIKLAIHFGFKLLSRGEGGNEQFFLMGLDRNSCKYLYLNKKKVV